VHIDDVLIPTMAVAASWLVIGAVIGGCGVATRFALLRAFSVRTNATPSRTDLWIGLVAVVAYLQAWSLVTGIGWTTWIVPLVVGLAGLAAAGRHLRDLQRPPIVVGALLLVGVLWLANQSLRGPGDYDLGLYHLGAIEYASDFGTVPGLGNLQTRLAGGSPQPLLVAFVDHGPWSDVGFRLVSGLLVSMLFLDIASRFGRGRSTPSFTRRVAVLLVPATVVVVGNDIDYRLSSPNLDLAAFVIAAAGSLYLAEAVEFPSRLTAAVTATATLGLAAAVRPLYWLPALVGVALLFGFVTRRESGVRLQSDTISLGRLAAVVLALPGVLLAGFLARQAILSGYPFYPSTVGGLPVNWRVPAPRIEEANRWVTSWARWPGHHPDEVLGSWDWLTHWLGRRTRDLDVVVPLLMLSSVIVALAGRSAEDRRRGREWLRPLAVVVVPALLALVAWLAIAPDPRFAFAPLWLVPVGLLAWALPAPAPVGSRHELLRPLTYALLIALYLVLLVVPRAMLAVPAALVLWILLVGRQRRRREHPGARLAYVAVVAVGLAAVGMIARRDAFTPQASDGGVLGSSDVGHSAVEPFTTRSGLVVWKPVVEDRCFRRILCTPEPTATLRLRGDDLSDGLTGG
jgi:hypothetical protein